MRSRGTELTVAHAWKVTQEQVVLFAKQWDPLPFHLRDEDAQKMGLRRLSAPGIIIAPNFNRYNIQI